MIGLTPAILGLGLTHDELYEYCTRIARALFACIHPDRHNGHNAGSVHVSEAFDLLRPPSFNAAIKAFQGSDAGLFPSANHEEETPAFAELQRRNVVLMGEEKTPRTRPPSRKVARFSGNPATIRSIPTNPGNPKTRSALQR
jgi:hypothetical protein